jgi:hypothetical protein
MVKKLLKLLEVNCHEFRLHNDFADNLVTRGLSPLPVSVQDNEWLSCIILTIFNKFQDAKSKFY